MPPVAEHRGELVVMFDSDFRDQDWWTFEIFLQGPGSGLDEVVEVTYVLPPSFAPPVRRVGDRESQFRLEGSTSSPFHFWVTVRYRGGETSSSGYYLKLPPFLPLDDQTSARLDVPLDSAGPEVYALPGAIQLHNGEHPPLTLTAGSAWVEDSSNKGEHHVALQFEVEGAPGFPAGTRAVVTSFRTPPWGTLLDAVKHGAARFVVPSGLDDLAVMSPDVIITVAGTGSLDFVARVDVALVPNVLHSLADQPANPNIALDGAPAPIRARWRISTTYTLKIEKSHLDRLTLGVYPKIGPGTVVSASI